MGWGGASPSLRVGSREEGDDYLQPQHPLPHTRTAAPAPAAVAPRQPPGSPITCSREGGLWGCWLVPRGWPGASGGALGPSGAPGQAGETRGPAARGRAGVPPREALPAGCLSSSWLGAVLQLEWLRMEGEGSGSPPRGRIGPWGARDLPLYPLLGPCLFILLPVVEQSVATQEHGHGPAVRPLQELGVRIQPRTPQGDPTGCCPHQAHLQPVQHILYRHLLPVCADCPHLQPVPAVPFPPAVLQAGSVG